MRENATQAPLSGKARCALRARAHSLQPTVRVAQSGITPGAMGEIDRALDAHELVKIHVAMQERAARAALLAAICAELNAQPVQVIGKMLVAFRARPEGSANADVKPENDSRGRQRGAHRARTRRKRS